MQSRSRGRPSNFRLLFFDCATTALVSPTLGARPQGARRPSQGAAVFVKVGIVFVVEALVEEPGGLPQARELAALAGDTPRVPLALVREAFVGGRSRGALA